MRYAELIRETHPDVMVMYHGTNSDSAEQIIKDGLAAKPTDRNFDGNDDPFHESFTGAYFSDSIAAALRYAVRSMHEFGSASAAIVTAKVPLAQAVPDEDIINFAVSDALKDSHSANEFISKFHRLLVQDRPIPVADRTLLLKLRRYYKAHEESEGTQYAKVYRDAIDKVAHAYAAMVFDTHPRYLGGVHTVRLPNGLPPENIISVTEFYVESDGVTDVRGVYGNKPIDQYTLQYWFNELLAQGWEP